MSDYWKKRDVIPKGGATGWYSRGYLPHFEGQLPQTITFRLVDSMPQVVLDQWEVELTNWPPGDAEVERRRRMDAYLDRDEGAAWMKDSRVVVQERNPVKAGLCEKPQDWPWSSASWRPFTR
jgi:hypothetical protein